MSVALPHTIRGLLVLLLLTPLVITPGVFAHFSVSKAIFARVIIEITFVGWVFLAIKNPAFRPPGARVLLALSFYVLAAVLAAVWGINPERSLWSTFDRMTGVVDLVHWSLFVLVLVSVVRTAAAWRWLLNGMLGVSLVLSLIALTQAYGYSFIPSIMAKCRADATLGNPSYLAPVLSVSVLIAAGLLVRSVLVSKRPWEGVNSQPFPYGEQDNSQGRSWYGAGSTDINGTQWQVSALRGFWLAVVGLGLLALVLTGTRGALIGVAAGALVMPAALLIWGNRQAFQAVALAAAGLLLAVGILFSLDRSVGLGIADCAERTATSRLATLTTTGAQDMGLDTRLAAVEAGFWGFLDRPLLGWGPENFSYAFDRHADAWVFRHGSFVQDKAHNQAVEELTTKGVVGGLAFLFLWLILARVILRRPRVATEEVLAYAVLGALAAYFVQNLFLFDTPSGLLVWSVLVGWVAAQESNQAPNALQNDETGQVSTTGGLWFRLQRGLSTALTPSWSRGAAAILLIALLGLSLYSFNLQPFLAARSFGQSGAAGITLPERLARAEDSFRTFPAMANQGRQLMFLQLLRNWDYWDPAERKQVREFFGREASLALGSDPQYAPMLITVILFIQSTTQDQAVLDGLGPLLQRLQAAAPHRPETHQLLANQALKEGDYSRALSIARGYQARAPGTEWFFAGIEAAAEAALAQGRD